jgi:hypothetical protein
MKKKKPDSSIESTDELHKKGNQTCFHIIVLGREKHCQDHPLAGRLLLSNPTMETQCMSAVQLFDSKNPVLSKNKLANSMKCTKIIIRQ